MSSPVLVAKSTAATSADDSHPPVTRETLAAGLRAFFRIVEGWGLGAGQAQVLLGRPSRATYFNWKRGQVATVPYDVVRRVSYILGIFKALEMLYPTPDNADAWIRLPNRAFGGQSPLDRMMGGDITDLAAVRAYLDAARGGWG